jgi:hypothetical protein
MSSASERWPKPVGDAVNEGIVRLDQRRERLAIPCPRPVEQTDIGCLVVQQRHLRHHPLDESIPAILGCDKRKIREVRAPEMTRQNISPADVANERQWPS